MLRVEREKTKGNFVDESFFMINEFGFRNAQNFKEIMVKHKF